MLPNIEDREDEAVELLRQIAGAVGGTATSGGELNIDASGGVTDRPDDAEYAATGEAGMTAGEEWEHFPWGFHAATVSVRFDDDVVIAFRNPHNKPQYHIPLRHPDDRPFVIGGSKAINADEMWIRRASTASGDVHCDVIAVK